MNLKVIAITTVLVALMYGGVSDATKSSRRQELDIKAPVDAIKAALLAFTTNFKLFETIAFIVELLTLCIFPLLPPDGRKMDINLVKSQVETLDASILSSISKINITEYCHSADFKVIHEHIWKKGSQLEDLLNFLDKFGYSGLVYPAIIKIYNDYKCPVELIETIPTEPRQQNVNRNLLLAPSNVREEFLKSQKPQLNQVKPLACDIQDLISKLQATGLLELINLVDTIIHELNSSPSLHFLVGKIQEPRKGVAVRGLRGLEEIKRLTKTLHEDIVANPTWKAIFQFLKDQIKIDFFKVNPIDTLISVLEFVLWGTPFPLPPALS